MVTDNPLMLINKETFTYHCYGCNKNTQNYGHICEGQVNRMVKAAKQKLEQSKDIIYAI